MSLINFLGWGNGNAIVNPQEDDLFKWEELPELVKLEIIKYLDRKALNNLRQISASTRYLIEYVHGLHVILPERIYKPAQCWLMLFYPLLKTTSYSRNITDSLVLHILHQMEGKKIFALEMNEMPPSLNPFPFSRFVQYPNCLRHVTLKYVDVDLVNSVFTNCRNLTTFKYQTSCTRYLPSGPFGYVIVQTSFSPVTLPATKDRLIGKINAFPPAPLYKLTRLKDMCLAIKKMTLNVESDWANVIFMLVALPKLPSLTKFQFEFHPDIWLKWKTQWLVLSCLGEFLCKTPNLQIFKYQSTLNQSVFLPEHYEFTRILSAMIRKFGSDTLKEVVDSMMVRWPGQMDDASFLVLPTRIFNGAGHSLTLLRELEIDLTQKSEHELFCSFIKHLRSPVLSVCKITTELHVTTVNPAFCLQKVFLLSRDDELQNLSIYQTITELFVTLGRRNSLANEIDPVEGYMVFNKSLANLPNLKVLNLKQPPLKSNNEYYLHRELFGTTVHPDPVQDVNTFSKLEKLSLENFYIKDFIPRMLILFKNLNEFNFQHSDICGVYTHGISSQDLLIVLSSLSKLDQVYVQPVYTSQLNLLGNPNVERCLRKAVDKRNALARMGEMTRLDGISLDFQFKGRSLLLGKYEFTFKPDQ